MTVNKRIFIGFMVFLLPFFTYGQSQPSNIVLTSTIIESKVYLRWSATNYEDWQLGNSNGLRLYRWKRKDASGTLSHQDFINSKTVLGEEIRPLGNIESLWASLSDTINSQIAAAAIYGESFDVVGFSDDTLVQAYQTNLQSENRFGFCMLACEQSFEVAIAAGQGFVDDNVDINSEYFYKIVFLDDNGNDSDSYALTTVSVVSGSIEFEPISNLSAIHQDSAVILSWNISNDYTSYDIEKSEDGVSFQKINESPIVFMENELQNSEILFYTDLLDDNTNTYVYRIIGKTLYGIQGSPSDEISVKGIPSPITARPSILELGEDSGGMIINWDFDDAFELKIIGYNIWRSNKIDGEYIKISSSIIPVGIHMYVDDSPNGANYYKVSVIDENEYELYSLPKLGQLIDIEPPSPPEGVIGEIDDKGVLTLSWNPNPELDILGYRVYWSNEQEGSYAQMTTENIVDTVFKYHIKLLTLSKNIYFKLVALDLHQNISDYSAVCSIGKPDIVPPVPAVINTISSSNPSLVNGSQVINSAGPKVYIGWILSSSNDVENYRLERRRSNEIDWEVLHEFENDSSYVDEEVNPDFTYIYRVLVYDYDGNIGGSEEVSIKPLSPSILPAPIIITNFKPNNKIVGLSVQFEMKRDFDFIQVYRAVKEPSDFISYKAIHKSEFLNAGVVVPVNSIVQIDFIADEGVSEGISYYYKIVVNYLSGASTLMSNVHLVAIQ